MGLAASTYTLFGGCAALAAYGLVPNIIYFGAVAVGLGAAVLWCGQGAYITGLTTPSRIGTWQGRFFGAFMLAPIIGQGIVLLVIDVGGASDQLLFAIMFGVSCAATLSFLCVRRRPAYLPPRPRPQHAKEGILRHALTTLRLGLELRAWLPGSIFLLSGVNQALMYGAAAQRIESDSMTAFALLTNGVCGVLGAMVFGRLSDTLSRRGVVLTSIACVALSVSLVGPAIASTYGALPMSNSTSDAFFIAAFGAFGLSEGGLQTQGRSCITVLFPEQVENGFAFMLFCLAIAMAVAFIYGPRLVYTVQLAIVAVGVLFAVCMALVVHLPREELDRRAILALPKPLLLPPLIPPGDGQSYRVPALHQETDSACSRNSKKESTV